MIIAFGDDLTYGYGVENKFNYTNQIENKTDLKIMNAGLHGEFSSEGLIRLPDVLKNKPKLVILCHGLNDIYFKHNVENLKKNLLAMIKLIKQSGSEVLLIGVSNFAILSKDIHKVYNEVAEQSGVLLEENILRTIFKSNLLKSDYTHPNVKGYELMADAFIEILNLQTLEDSSSRSVSRCNEYKLLKGMC